VVYVTLQEATTPPRSLDPLSASYPWNTLSATHSLDDFVFPPSKSPRSLVEDENHSFIYIPTLLSIHFFGNEKRRG